MAVVNNIPCPMCQEVGHDKTGNHLMVFSDGNKLCNRSNLHANGEPYFVPAGEGDGIVELEVTGKIRYTSEQFNELDKSGKLGSPFIRALALSGMKMQQRFECSSVEEKAILERDFTLDLEWFDQLKIKHLVDRGIHGKFAKLYNVRVGHDADGKVNRHYYPQYTDGKMTSAKVRNLPKNFSGGLGKLFGHKDMWGMSTLKQVLDSGQTMRRLTLTGGECDAMAAQEMLCEFVSTKSNKGDYSNRLYHVWSPNKGEHSFQEILDNKEHIMQFQEVVIAFDNDEAGKALTKKVARMLGAKALILDLPPNLKDANQCKKDGFKQAFINAWWAAAPLKTSAFLRPLSHYRDKAILTPSMGKDWPWPDMNKATFGIRDYYLSVWGAGSGVGKTKSTKQVLYELTQVHKEPTVCIYLEERPEITLRSLAGMYTGKDFNAPIVTDKANPLYEPQFDYTEEEATASIDRMVDEGLVMLGDLEGKKDVDSVMELMNEAVSLGYTKFIIDNLTAFQHKGKNGDVSGSAQAIDETMRALGTLKDESPVFIMLLSHLNRPDNTRTPHEEGGEVRMTDFRGSGSITFWANDVWGIERNTKAASMNEKTLTTYRNVKNRDFGFMTGARVCARLDLETGHLNQVPVQDASSALPEPDYKAATQPDGENEF